jgi:hypothetical protein
MKLVYRHLLEDNVARLCRDMDPSQVLGRLVNSGIFQKYDAEKVNHKVTTQEKTTCIIDTLMNMPFEALSEFLCVLASIDAKHYALASEMQPVNYRIAWFSPSPTQAAAAVYVLEKYAGARFSKMARCGDSLVVRRARLFPKEFKGSDDSAAPADDGSPLLDVAEVVSSSHQTELCLAFPVANADTTDALGSWFGQDIVSDSEWVWLCRAAGSCHCMWRC